MRKSISSKPLQTRCASTFRRRGVCLAVAVAAVQGLPGLSLPGFVVPGGAALAINGTWSVSPAFEQWSNPANWVSGNIADGSGFTADFGATNLTIDKTVILDTNRTIGNMIFGDTTPSHNWTLSNSGGSVLTLAVGSGTPTVTVNNQTTTIVSVMAGTQGLAKAGAGLLVLTGGNTYSGGTTVNAGSLAVGASGAVLAAGTGLTVNSGATFNYGNGATINNSAAPIGTMTLNNGTYRLSGGSGDFYLNQLIVGSTGGTIDLTGSSNYWTHFTGAGAGITVNTDSTWTGAATSRIQNDTGALLPITINNDKTVTSSVNFANGVSGFGYLVGGNSSNGTLYLKNPTGTNSANFRVQFSKLRVDDMADLGTGTITLAGVLAPGSTVENTGTLAYSGSTASSSKPLSLDGSGGQIQNFSPGATLTLTGVINETGGTGRALSIYGANGFASVVALTAANAYTGPTGVTGGGILSIPTIANGGVASPLGASSSAPGNLQIGGTFNGLDGTLRYTGPTASTDRGATLNNASAKSIIDVATPATTLTLSGQLVGVGGLTKAGPGTLLLMNNTNTYANGTTVDAGTLAVGAGGNVLPAGKNVTVNSGATFDFGNGIAVSNNAASPIGTLTLSNGTYRVQTGSGDFYLNQLVIGPTGGTLNFAGTNNYWTRFTGSGAGITVNGDSTWTGSSVSQIRNETNALLPITINNGKTVTSSVNFINSTSGFGYVLNGNFSNGTLYLKNPTGTNTANFRVQFSNLRVDDMAALGTGTITLAGPLAGSSTVETFASLLYSGPTASSSKTLTLDASGGQIHNSTPGATLTLTGVINETGGTGRALSIYGANGFASVVALTAANTYTGPTGVTFGGILSVPTIANGGVASPLGASSNAPANLQIGGVFNGLDGTLRYTGPTASTDRGATLNNASAKSILDVNTAGTTLTMSGQLVGAGGLTKAGPGTLVLSNVNNTYANGTTVDAGTLAVGGGGAALPAGKNLTVNSGATFNYGNGATMNNNGSAIGTMTLNNGTYRVSGGFGDFYLNQLAIGATGGSVDFAGAGAFFTHFTGAGAALNVNANTVWTGGGGGARFQNDTTTPVPITVNSGSTLTSNIAFANGTSGFGFRLLGGGVLSFSGSVNNSANLRVEDGLLAVSNIGSLGSSAITLAGTFLSGSTDTTAVLLYSGPTDSTVKPISLDANGGVFIVSTAGTNLTLSGTISEAGGTGRALTMVGGAAGSTLTLAGTNSYTGPTMVSGGGILSIGSIANGGVASPLGASSNAPSNLRIAGGTYAGDGTLRYTGATASTDRGVTLNSFLYKSTIEVTNPATTLTFGGAFVGSGSLFKTGPGTLRMNGANTYFAATTLQAGTISANTFAYTTVLNASNDGLDIQGGKFIFDYTGNVNPVSTIKSILTAGYAQATKFSTGQIRATTLAANRTLGYGDSGSAVTVMLTLPGDADLNGVVNFNDFLALQNNFNNPNTTFAQGNFDYNGTTNFNDFLILQNFFGQSITGAAVAVTASQVAAMTAFAATVPEPAGLAMVGAAIALAGRRRRVG